jgi:hypothetical protein
MACCQRQQFLLVNPGLPTGIKVTGSTPIEPIIDSVSAGCSSVIR